MREDIVIFTTSDDLHGGIVSELLSKRSASLRLVFTDRLSSDHQATFCVSSSDENEVCHITDRLEKPVSLQAASCVWWRRNRLRQFGVNYKVEEYNQTVTQSWQAILTSRIGSSNGENWLNDPMATQTFSNKVAQLRVAKKAGLDIPRTLVSNSNHDVRDFVHNHRQAIVKPLNNNVNSFVYTRIIDGKSLIDESVRVSPAIYQEYIAGSVHLRVNVFGDKMYAFEVESDAVDWRGDRIKASFVNSSQEFVRKCMLFLKLCGLKMGILDFKLRNGAEPVFLECNPQGQFAFLEPLTDYPICEKFVDYLISFTEKQT